MRLLTIPGNYYSYKMAKIYLIMILKNMLTFIFMTVSFMTNHIKISFFIIASSL